MSTITIFGSGNMGSAIGGIFSAGGADVEHITSSSSGAVVGGDVVIVAVPFGAHDDIVEQYGDQLAGKVVVDISNPVSFPELALAVPADSSEAAELATKLPQSRVLKAFNTNFAGTLADASSGAVVLVAGDDDGAKSQLIDAIGTGGFSAVDAGPLSAARDLEAIGRLQMQLAFAHRISGFSVATA